MHTNHELDAAGDDFRPGQSTPTWRCHVLAVIIAILLAAGASAMATVRGQDGAFVQTASSPTDTDRASSQLTRPLAQFGEVELLETLTREEQALVDWATTPTVSTDTDRTKSESSPPALQITTRSRLNSSVAARCSTSSGMRGTTPTCPPKTATSWVGFSVLMRGTIPTTCGKTGVSSVSLSRSSLPSSTSRAANSRCLSIVRTCSVPYAPQPAPNRWDRACHLALPALRRGRPPAADHTVNTSARPTCQATSKVATIRSRTPSPSDGCTRRTKA